MTAIEFVQKFGWDKAKKDCQIYGWKNTSFWIQLKHLVSSYDLVEHVGGLEKSKYEYECLLKFRDIDHFLLKQAIADVESVESLKEVT